jgi:hypothetical protein
MSSSSPLPLLITVTALAGGAYWLYTSSKDHSLGFDPSLYVVGKQPLNNLQIATYKARDDKVANYYRDNASYIARVNYAAANSDGKTHSVSWEAAYKRTLSPLWDPVNGGFMDPPVQPVKVIPVPRLDDGFFSRTSADPIYIAAMQAGRLTNPDGSIAGGQSW